MVDKRNAPDQAAEREDALVMAAYERRLAGGSQAEVPAGLQAEVESYLSLHKQVSALELPTVSPGVRSAILTAAAQAAADRKPVSLLARVMSYLTRPGPMLVGATAAAIAVAIAVRPSAPPAPAAPAPSEAVAMNEPAAPPAEAPAVAAAPALVEAEPVAAAAAPPAPPPENAAMAPNGTANAEVPQGAKDNRASLRTIAAQPASLSPPAREKAAAAPSSKANAKAAVASEEKEAAEGQVAADKAPPAQMAKQSPTIVQPADTERNSDEPQQAKGYAGRDYQAAAPAAEPDSEAAAEKSANLSAKAEVAELRARALKASGEAKVNLLHKLIEVAQRAGDDAAEDWARAALKETERALAKSKAMEPAKTPPVQRAKSAPKSQPLKGSSETP